MLKRTHGKFSSRNPGSSLYFEEKAMSNRSMWHRVCSRLYLLFGIALFSQPAISQDNTNIAPSAKSLCDIAKQFSQDGLLEGAIARYEAILKDEKLLKDSHLSCAREGLVKAKRDLLNRRCNTADEIRKEGRLLEAERIYKSLLDDKASSEAILCARQGLLEVATIHVMRGDNLKNERDFSAAEKEYEAALAASEEITTAYKKKQDVLIEKKVSHVTALADLGLEGKAKERLDTYLGEDPELVKRAKDFAYITWPRVPLWTELRKARVDTALSFFGLLPHTIRAMPLTEALILGFFIWLMGRKFWWGNPTLNIKDFTGKKNGDGLDDFAAELEHQLVDLKSTSRDVQMVSAPIAPVNVDVSAVLPLQAGWKLLTELQRVLPSLLAGRSLVVTGLLHEKEGGVTIRVESGNRIIAKHTLWAREFGGGTDLNDLAICGAIWVLFILHTTPVQSFAKQKAFLRKIYRAPLKILGTSDWEAYAWFALGVKRYRKDDDVKLAKAAFLKALTLDPKFLASRVNLAGVYHRLYDVANKEGDLKEAERHLMYALKQLDIVETISKGRVDRDDPSLYTGLFSRAAIAFDLAVISNKPEYAEQAHKVADDLVKRMLTARARNYFNENLTRYLEWRLPVAECMGLGLKTASLSSSVKPDSDDENKLERVKAILEERVDFYSLYNLSCTYALFAAQAQDENTSQEYYLLSMDFLERSLETAASMKSLGKGLASTFDMCVERAKSDAAFKCYWDDPEFKRIIEKRFHADLVSEPTQPNIAEANGNKVDRGSQTS